MTAGSLILFFFSWWQTESQLFKMKFNQLLRKSLFLKCFYTHARTHTHTHTHNYTHKMSLFCFPVLRRFTKISAFLVCLQSQGQTVDHVSWWHPLLVNSYTVTTEVTTTKSYLMLLLLGVTNQSSSLDLLPPRTCNTELGIWLTTNLDGGLNPSKMEIVLDWKKQTYARPKFVSAPQYLCLFVMYT